MPDNKYCYPGSDVLKNKLGITDADDLIIGTGIEYDYYSYDEYENEKLYTDKYKEKITKMNSEKIIE